MAAEADHEKVAAQLARLAQPRPQVTNDVLAYLNLDPNTVEARALVLLCKRYDLDPLLGHVRIISVKGGGNSAYVTRDGMLEIAHRSGVFDGMTTDEERETENGFSATVSVYRRDMGHPFTYRGGCGKTEQQAKDGHGPEMALARAERRALRRAFNIPADDVSDDEPITIASADEHRVVGQVDRTGRLICACGEMFDTAWQFGAHRNANRPLPPVQPAVTPGDSPPPHKAAELAGRPRKDARRDQSPPPDFYDNLPEAQGRGV